MLRNAVAKVRLNFRLDRDLHHAVELVLHRIFDRDDAPLHVLSIDKNV